MNATKFVVLLLIGVLCANVGARQLEEVSKDTKLSIPFTKTSTKGIGAELDVNTEGFVYNVGYSSSNAARSPNGPYGSGSGSQSTSTSESSKATGPVTSSTTYSSAGGGATSGATTSGDSAGGVGTAYGGGSTTGTGTSSPATPAGS